MPKLISKKTGKAIEVAEGQYIRRAAEELGVLFACNTGMCGACEMDVVEGEDNLSELTQEEKDLGMDKKKRLACQCRMGKGDVEIDC